MNSTALCKITDYQEQSRKPICFISVIFILLFLWLIIVKTSQLYYNYNNSFVGHDPYQLFEGAKELTLTGVSKLTFWPNSSAGLDIFMWHHLFPPFLYFFIDSLWGIEVQDLFIFSTVEFILLIIALCIIMTIFANRVYFVIFLGVIAFDPLFHSQFINRYIFRWPLVFALLSLICFFLLLKKNKHENLLSFLTGFFAVMSPLSFISIGVPAFIGVSVVFFVEHIFFDRGISIKKRLIWFSVGVFTPVVILFLYLFNVLGKESLYNLIYVITNYSEVMSNKPDSANIFIRIGYFFSTIIVPVNGLSLLPIGIAAALLNYNNRIKLNDTEQFLVRVSLLLTLSWLICALLMSAHFFSTRMVWMLPFYVLQLFIAIKYKNNRPFAFHLLLAFGFFTLSIQWIYNVLGKPYAPYGYGAAALMVFFTTLIFIYIYSFFQKYKKTEMIKVVNIVIFFLLIVLITPTIKGYAKGTSILINSKESFTREEPFAQTLIQEVREITDKVVAPGERVLTNSPYREFFQMGVKRQLVYFFRGLYGGATLEPADKIILLGTNPYEYIYPNYKNVTTGSNLYFRGFVYNINRKVELTGDRYLLIGAPRNHEEPESIIYPKDYVEKEVIESYFDWRLEKGLPVN